VLPLVVVVASGLKSARLPRAAVWVCDSDAVGGNDHRKKPMYLLRLSLLVSSLTLSITRLASTDGLLPLVVSTSFVV
jgi:hypothetical protein